jgi:hypothetical protein
VRAVAAFDPGLFTNTADPLIAASRGIAGTSGLPALESAWIDILTPSEKRAEERDFFGG